MIELGTAVNVQLGHSLAHLLLPLSSSVNGAPVFSETIHYSVDLGQLRQRKCKFRLSKEWATYREKLDKLGERRQSLAVEGVQI